MIGDFELYEQRARRSSEPAAWRNGFLAGAVAQPGDDTEMRLWLLLEGREFAEAAGLLEGLAVTRVSLIPHPVNCICPECRLRIDEWKRAQWTGPRAWRTEEAA
ncbi:hypothetical protein [Streptomyces sp. URMC 124]|uniref:hypothetical protein n=1 Tax=Streptomyces sp. URMC 124 TaxID=3423405 RepID=UPI003F196404